MALLPFRENGDVPAGPGGPIGPCGPCRPSGPCDPVGPAGPAGPCGPATPIIGLPLRSRYPFALMVPLVARLPTESTENFCTPLNCPLKIVAPEVTTLNTPATPVGLSATPSTPIVLPV